jgi:2-polyprenyl-6-methoxyphenol hydroxylase-like FAD-dependent oxidoreductase
VLRSAITTEVAIVGGGPAGAAASLTLARYTDRGCVLIEASDYSAPRIGETVSPALLPLLDYLGAPRPAAEAMLVCNGSEAAWGGAAAERSSIFSEGLGWTLDRRRFDASLADAAEARGATVLRRTVLRGAESAPDGGWRLRLDSGGMSHVLTARQVIDASGRACAFARRAGAARQGNDRLVGIAAYLRCAPETPAARSILIEAAPDGWWYATALPGDRAVLVYMTDADLIRASGEAADRLFARKRAETELVGARFAAAAPVAAPRVHPAESRRLLPCVAAGGSSPAMPRRASIRCRPSASAMPWRAASRRRGSSTPGSTATRRWPHPIRVISSASARNMTGAGRRSTPPSTAGRHARSGEGGRSRPRHRPWRKRAEVGPNAPPNNLVEVIARHVLISEFRPEDVGVVSCDLSAIEEEPAAANDARTLIHVRPRSRPASRLHRAQTKSNNSITTTTRPPCSASRAMRIRR